MASIKVLSETREDAKSQRGGGGTVAAPVSPGQDFQGSDDHREPSHNASSIQI